MVVGTVVLGIRFKQGETKGQASRTSIVDGKNFTYLVDYGWAVLAKRNKHTGKIIYYSGWYGYSPSTSKHISQLGLRGEKELHLKRKLSDII
jgi:hypothetical protein